MADPYCVGYGDPPFRSKSLHGNPGVARLQLGNAPLERRTDILIRQDVELRPEAFCGTLPHRRPAAGTAVKRVMRIVALLGLPIPAHLQPEVNAAHSIIDLPVAQILQHIAADPRREVVGLSSPVSSRNCDRLTGVGQRLAARISMSRCQSSGCSGNSISCTRSTRCTPVSAKPSPCSLTSKYQAGRGFGRPATTLRK